MPRRTTSPFLTCTGRVIAPSLLPDNSSIHVTCNRCNSRISEIYFRFIHQILPSIPPLSVFYLTIAPDKIRNYRDEICESIRRLTLRKWNIHDPINPNMSAWKTSSSISASLRPSEYPCFQINAFVFPSFVVLMPSNPFGVYNISRVVS